jgi:hypothetical protein
MPSFNENLYNQPGNPLLKRLTFMGLDWKSWNRSDFLYGIVAPLAVVLIIVGLSQVTPFLMRQGSFESFGIIFGIISEIEELVIIVAVPLLLGLVWNRWAGGASGFLLGSIYAMWFAVGLGSYASNNALPVSMGFGPTMLGWLLSAMLIGYIAGALNKRSDNFRRMLIAGVVSTTVGGVLLFSMFQLSPSNVMIGADAFLLTVLSRAAAGVIIPIIAKVFMWYGVAMHKT